MPRFRTKIKLNTYPFQLSHEDNVTCIGSCFAENMGQQLIAAKFETQVNPFGILYHPMAIKEALERLLSARPFDESELVLDQGMWHSFLHHSQFSHPDKSHVLHNINQSLTREQAFLQKTNRLIITFGTARVYEWLDGNKIVANCHKIPAKAFSRRLLSVDEIIEAMSEIFTKLQANKPDIEIVLAISPVRHIRDGLVENQQSKSVLSLATAALCENFSFVHYFPSYEIVLDELRDYRFFKKDMIHPNEVAIDYIWDLFSNTFFVEDTQMLLQKIAKIRLAAEHRPFRPNSEKHQKFIKNTLSIIQKLNKQHPRLSFEKEIATFRN